MPLRRVCCGPSLVTSGPAAIGRYLDTGHVEKQCAGSQGGESRWYTPRSRSESTDPTFEMGAWYRPHISTLRSFFALSAILAHCPYRNRGINGPTRQLGVLSPPLELIQCEIGLQVQLEGDDRQKGTVEQGALSQQDGKDPMIPTEFVWHGQGLEDPMRNTR
jgi:hypothetical protein